MSKNYHQETYLCNTLISYTITAKLALQKLQIWDEVLLDLATRANKFANHYTKGFSFKVKLKISHYAVNQSIEFNIYIENQHGTPLQGTSVLVPVDTDSKEVHLELIRISHYMEKLIPRLEETMVRQHLFYLANRELLIQSNKEAQ